MARRARTVLALLALVQLLAFAQTPVRRALLISGADPVKGLPFFPPNALASLVGAYDLALPAPPGSLSSPSTLTEVWYTRESLVLGPAWKRSDGTLPQALVLDRPQGPVYCLAGEGYRLFLEPPNGSGGGAEAAWRAFVPAFERKFQAFFLSAATDAELSFPAFVDY